MDQRLIDLFNSYTHGGMSRRAFLDRFTAIAGGAAAASMPGLDGVVLDLGPLDGPEAAAIMREALRAAR